MTETDVKPPMPVVTPLTEFFWEGAKQHKLLILRCQSCGHVDWGLQVFEVYDFVRLEVSHGAFGLGAGCVHECCRCSGCCFGLAELDCGDE